MVTTHSQTQPDLSFQEKYFALRNTLRGVLNVCNHISGHANVQDIAEVYYRAGGQGAPARLDQKIIAEKLKALKEGDAGETPEEPLDPIELTVVVYYHDAVDGVVRNIKELVLDGYELSKDIYIESEGRHTCHLVVRTGSSEGSELSYTIRVMSILPRFLPVGM